MDDFPRNISALPVVLKNASCEGPYELGRRRREEEILFEQERARVSVHPLDQFKAGYRDRSREGRTSPPPDPRPRREAAPGRGDRISPRAARAIRGCCGRVLRLWAQAVPDFRSRLGEPLKIAAVLLALLLTTPAALAAGYVAWNWARIESDVALALQNVLCAEAVLIEGPDAGLAHVEPRLPDSACPQPKDSRGRTPPRPTLFAPFPSPAAARAFAEGFRAQEGALWVEETWFGHDAKGPARYIRGAVLQLLTGQRNRAGATGPIGTVYELLLQEPERRPLFPKILNLVGASVYAHRHLRTNEDRIAFVNLAPTVANVEIPRSGRLGSLALLGTAQPETLAEVCRLARAAGQPVPLVGRRGVTAAVARRWANHIGPSARRCVGVLDATEEEREQALADLRALCGDLDLCLRGEPRWEDWAEETRQGAREAWEAARRKVVARSAAPYVSLPVAFRGASATLRDLIARGAPNPARVTLRPEVQGALIEAAREISGAELAAATFELSGARLEVLGLYGERAGAVFEPTVFDAQGAPQRGQSPWHGASLNKTAILMAAHLEGVREVCLEGRPCQSLAKAFASSDNDVFVHLARLLDEPLKTLRARLGYRGRPPSAPSERARDAVLGFDTRLPPDLHAALFGALAAGRVEGIFLIGPEPVDAGVDLGALGFGAASRAAVLADMRAPLLAGGTLAAMAGNMDLPKGCVLLAAKSGTHSVGDRNLQRTSVVLTACGERRFVTFALAAHGEALKTPHAALGPLHAAGIRAALGFL